MISNPPSPFSKTKKKVNKLFSKRKSQKSLRGQTTLKHFILGPKTLASDKQNLARINTQDKHDPQTDDPRAMTSPTRSETDSLMSTLPPYLTSPTRAQADAGMPTLTPVDDPAVWTSITSDLDDASLRMDDFDRDDEDPFLTEPNPPRSQMSDFPYYLTQADPSLSQMWNPMSPTSPGSPNFSQWTWPMSPTDQIQSTGSSQVNDRPPPNDPPP